jgi:hypothetical protein
VIRELALSLTDAGGQFGGIDDPTFLAMNPHGCRGRKMHMSLECALV